MAGEPPQSDFTDMLRLQHSALLETLESGVVILDARDVVTSQNESASRLWGIKGPLASNLVQETELGSLCPDLASHLEQTRSDHKTANFSCSAGAGKFAHTLSITLKPMVNPNGERVGTVIYMEDISPREKLQSTIAELEATGEELQRALSTAALPWGQNAPPDGAVLPGETAALASDANQAASRHLSLGKLTTPVPG